MNKLPILGNTKYNFLLSLIFMFLLIVFPVNALITIEDKGTNYIYWMWNNSGVDSISIDSKLIAEYDNSNSYTLNDIESNSLHQIKLFNDTSGEVDSNITKSVAMTETAQEGFFSLANLYLLFIIGLICILIGVFTGISLISFAGAVIGITGLIASFNNSFGLGLLFFILIISGILSGLNDF